MLNRVSVLEEQDQLQAMLEEYEKLFPELCDTNEVKQFESRLDKSTTDLTDDDIRKIDREIAQTPA